MSNIFYISIIKMINFLVFIFRYLAILKPMYGFGIDKRGKIMIFLAWFAAAICSIPQVSLYIFK